MSGSSLRLRKRRLRTSPNLRKLVRENHLRVDQFVAPLFVMPGHGIKEEISSMPGQYRFSIDTLVEECQEIYDLGIPAVMLFGIPEEKDAMATHAWDKDGIVNRALRAVKKAVPELLLIADVCMCEYTDHGHCGLLQDGGVLNDPTLDMLARIANANVRSGADIIAPSDMMDGRVAHLRKSLDDNNFQDIPIMSYSSKFASAFYGPFRDAAESTPQSGDRKTYQMDPANAREALEESLLDAAEGADILMVKPALAYLDVIASVKAKTLRPLAAYNVSGEYSMIKLADAAGAIDGQAVMLESLLSMVRAGADILISYFAKDVAKYLKNQ